MLRVLPGWLGAFSFMSPRSMTHADGIATVGNFAGHCGQGNTSAKFLTAYKVTHNSGTHIFLSGQSISYGHIHLPGFEEVWSHNAWEKKWEYLIGRNNGYPLSPFTKHSGHPFDDMQNVLTPWISKEPTHKFNPFPKSAWKAGLLDDIRGFLSWGGG